MNTNMEIKKDMIISLVYREEVFKTFNLRPGDMISSKGPIYDEFGKEMNADWIFLPFQTIKNHFKIAIIEKK